MTYSKREEWRPVVGYEGLYEVSSMGRVRSLDREIVDRLGRTAKLRGRVLKERKSSSGYLHVVLHDGDRRDLKTHRLVLTAFTGEPPSRQSVARHLNGNPLDNRLSNLAWGTQKDNAQDCIRHGRRPRGERHSSSKLSRDDVFGIIDQYSRGGVSKAQLGREYGVHTSSIRGILSGRNWKWLTQEAENV